jgi:hypothetical protein
MQWNTLTLLQSELTMANLLKHTEMPLNRAEELQLHDTQLTITS